MNKPIIALTTVAMAATFALTGCGKATHHDLLAPQADAPAAPPTSLEDQAQTVAATMDPAFSDDGVWQAVLPLAHSYCDLADVSGQDTAAATLLIQSQGTDVTAAQVGIVIGVAQALYCPQYNFGSK